MNIDDNVAYPWYSDDKVLIWEAIRILLALPDSQDYKFNYDFHAAYFQTIEAIEQGNAWNFFLEHYALQSKRFLKGDSGCTSWCFVFYNLLLALEYDKKHQTASGTKVRSPWYSRKDFVKLENRVCTVQPYKLWSWHSFASFPPVERRSEWSYYSKEWKNVDYPVRALKPSLVKAIEDGDLGLLRLEIDLSRHQETTLKYVQRTLLNRQMYEWLFLLRKDYAFPKEELIPELEYFLWERWNHDHEALNSKEENEEGLAKWDEDNNLVRLFSFSEELCNATLEQLEAHDLLTPVILKAVLLHLGKRFHIKIPNIKTIVLAARLKSTVRSLPEEKQPGAMEILERYFRKSYFQLADVCREYGVNFDGKDL
ncbi:MAG: hypothetical protein IJS08_00635 [Victivallales bacterium]|nr:hypothetical protein [Victivallales bacterium]